MHQKSWLSTHGNLFRFTFPLDLIHSINLNMVCHSGVWKSINNQHGVGGSKFVESKDMRHRDIIKTAHTWELKISLNSSLVWQTLVCPHHRLSPFFKEMNRAPRIRSHVYCFVRDSSSRGACLEETPLSICHRGTAQWVEYYGRCVNFEELRFWM